MQLRRSELKPPVESLVRWMVRLRDRTAEVEFPWKSAEEGRVWQKADIGGALARPPAAALLGTTMCCGEEGFEAQEEW